MRLSRRKRTCVRIWKRCPMIASKQHGACRSAPETCNNENDLKRTLRLRTPTTRPTAESVLQQPDAEGSTRESMQSDNGRAHKRNLKSDFDSCSYLRRPPNPQTPVGKGIVRAEVEPGIRGAAPIIGLCDTTSLIVGQFFAIRELR